jgi:hypothetical protein
MSDGYLPGTCNIGTEEINRRKQVAWIGAIATIFGAISFINKYHSHTPRLFLFIPAAVFAIGFVQSRKKFCLAYGFAGVFNFGEAGKAQQVRSNEDKALDRKTAFSILGQSLVLALIITLIIFLLPA